MVYLKVVLKILAVLVGLAIVVLTVAKASGFALGIRIAQNIFSEDIAGMSVTSWLLIVFILAESLILGFLFISLSAPSPR